MTTDRSPRFERVLPELFEELADARTPDYLEAAIERASTRPQRPAWTFPERWLPMDITTRVVPTTRMPWRQLGVLALIGILIALAAVAYIGSRQRLPAPFGIADNGLVAYASDGDIFTIDPVTNAISPIVAGPEEDSDPNFSPDGTKLAFRRTATVDGRVAEEILVADVDGSNARGITIEPIPGGVAGMAWSPDARSLLVLSSTSVVSLFSATEVAEPREIASQVGVFLRPFRPPDGSAVLIGRPSPQGLSLVRLDLDTMEETVLAQSPAGADLGGARWSPDGSQVVYSATPADDPDSQRLFIVNADGSGARQITDAPGVWFDIDASWSPDGGRIAFVRYERVGSDVWQVRPIGIYSVADGSVTEVGPLPRETRAQDPGPEDTAASFGEGFHFEWSPDGGSLLALPSEASAHPVIIDADDGTWRNLGPLAQPVVQTQTWQRIASD
jgi:dipeptidyl aminopeptidase/acylaminoacyl peptidase